MFIRIRVTLLGIELCDDLTSKSSEKCPHTEDFYKVMVFMPFYVHGVIQCCPSAAEMTDARVVVTEKVGPTPSAYELMYRGYRLCGGIQGQPVAWTTVIIECQKQAIGRYMYIYRAFSNTKLILCEVEVFGEGVWPNCCQWCSVLGVFVVLFHFVPFNVLLTVIVANGFNSLIIYTISHYLQTHINSISYMHYAFPIISWKPYFVACLDINGNKIASSKKKLGCASAMHLFWG